MASRLLSRVAMKAILAVMMLAACTGGGGGDTDGGSTGSGDAPAWSGGPNGHLYMYSGPLYDIDARDGHVLRQITVVHPVSQLVANADTAYFTKFDDAGQGRTWTLAPGATDVAQISDTSMSIFGVAGSELIGIKNGANILRMDTATGAVTMFQIPAGPSGAESCESGDLSGHVLYLACIEISASGTAAGMQAFDLDTNTFAPFVVVAPSADALALASNVTNTPSGVIFTLYTGTPPNGATMGTRTAYKITGTTVSAPVDLPGTSDDLDEASAVGNTVFLTAHPSGEVVPFDAATMTAGAPITVDHPRHLVTGGGQVWIGTSVHDGQLAKLDPATGAVVYKSFEVLVSTNLDSLAYGGE